MVESGANKSAITNAIAELSQMLSEATQPAPDSSASDSEHAAPIARYPWYTLIDPSHLPSYGQASLVL